MRRAEVDVWLLPRPTVLPPLAWLDDAERGRAATQTPETAAGFVAARRLLRAALGQRLGLPPDRVPLAARCARCGGPHGQVRVLTSARCHVSVSRSGPLVAVATAELPVGVDVESVAAVGASPVADVVLSAVERERHSRLPAGERPADLARTWARKEAVLKALGTGLELDPTSVTLTVPVTTVRAPLDASAGDPSGGGSTAGPSGGGSSAGPSGGSSAGPSGGGSSEGSSGGGSAVGASGGGVAVAVADLGLGVVGAGAGAGAGVGAGAVGAVGAGAGAGAVGAVGAVAVVGVAGLDVRVHDGAAVLAGAASGTAGSGEDVRPWP